MAADKQSVIAEYRAAHRAFLDAISGLSDGQMTAPFLENWSVREVIGHLAGWHQQLGLGLERMAQGLRPSPEGVNWGDVQSFNDQFTMDMAGAAPAVLLADLDARVARFITAVEALPDDRFGEGKTANRIVAGAGFEHFHEHADEIKAARAAGKL